MIRYLILDDEPLAHDLILSFADNLSFLQLKKQCYNALEALDYLTTEEVDLIFLDLNMPKLKGFDFLRSLAHPPAIIVTTAYQEHALEGFELNVTDYLLKPFSFERFLQAVQKVRANMLPKTRTAVITEITEVPAGRIFIKSDKRFHQISLSEILFVSAYGNYTKIQLENRMILNHESISGMEASLPITNFLRVHKSYLVALDKIDAIEGHQILIGAHKIPVGQTYRRIIGQLIQDRRV